MVEANYSIYILEIMMVWDNICVLKERGNGDSGISIVK